MAAHGPLATAKLYRNAFHNSDMWASPDIPFATIATSRSSAANAGAFRDASYNLHDTSPCVVTHVDEADPHHIVIAHSPRKFRGQVVVANPANDRPVVMIIN